MPLSELKRGSLFNINSTLLFFAEYDYKWLNTVNFMSVVIMLCGLLLIHVF